MNILLLREEEKPSDKYHTLFQKENFKANSIPVLDFVYDHFEELKTFANNIHKYSGLIFTSKRAIAAFKKAVDEKKIQEISKKEQLNIYVVGRSTEVCLKKLGFKSTGSETGNAKELSELIIKEEKNTEKPLMFLCGNLARETIPKRLTEVGIPNEAISCYRTIPNTNFKSNLNLYLQETRPEVIVFFSPSGAEFYLSDIKQAIHDFEKVKIVCIGQYTAEVVGKLNGKVDGVAASPTPESLLECIKVLYTELTAKQLTSLSLEG